MTFTRPFYDRARLSVSATQLSISGIQTKMPVVLDGDQLTLAESGGRYILKPAPTGPFQRLDAVPANEHLTMQIARQVFRIPVADNGLVFFQGGEPAYLTRRFDVHADGSRSLQEDFAQIAGRSQETGGEHYKYDSSYEEIGLLVRKHVADPVRSIEGYFRLVCFNYLVNNGDAHLKNFSLLRDDRTGSYSLSPAYDLLDTRLHVPNETRTALPLFRDDFETESFKANAFYAYDDFHELARRLGIGAAVFGRIMRRFVQSDDAVTEMVDRSSLSAECRRLYKAHVRDAIKAMAYSFARSR